MYRNKLEVWDEATQTYIYLSPEQAQARQNPPPERRRNRYDGGANLVPASTANRPAAPVAYPVVESSIHQHSDGRAFEALPGVVETATPLWRAVALVIRSAWPALAITGLMLLAAWIVGADEYVAAGILILGALLVAGFWHFTDRAERRDSAAGIEHHKIDAAQDLARLRELNQHELKRGLVNNYIKQLGRAMIHQMIEAVTHAKERNELRTLVLHLFRDNERLRLENAHLRHENHNLRRRLQDAELRLLRRAEQDAYLIGGLFFAELPISRRACADIGLGHRRWVRAMALLKVGRVAQGSQIRVESPDDFARGVKVAVERVKRDGLDALLYRMPLYSKR